MMGLAGQMSVAARYQTAASQIRAVVTSTETQAVLRLLRTTVFLPAATTGAADSAGVFATAFACLLASIAFLRFSGSPLFLAALLRALVNDFAERGVLIANPYFPLYSFGLMP